VLIDPQGRGRQFVASRLMQMDGTRAGGFVLSRQPAAGKWGAATYVVAQTATEATDGIGHRDHREHRDETAAASHPMPPMDPMPYAGGDADEMEGELSDLASPVGAFVRERCIVNQHHCVECEVLFGAWTRWCDELHRDHKGTIQSFGRDLRAVVPDLEVTQPRDPRTGERLRYYQGLGLLS
jgi:hypothetical protein